MPIGALEYARGSMSCAYAVTGVATQAQVASIPVARKRLSVHFIVQYYFELSECKPE